MTSERALWARMDRDLGAAPSVLFVGGGGYTLPTKLLASRPKARAIAGTFERLKTIVDGPVYVNLIDDPDGRLARGVYAILTSLYPHVQAEQGDLGSTGRTNILLAASRKPLDPRAGLPSAYEPARISNGRAFTDDRGWVGHR